MQLYVRPVFGNRVDFLFNLLRERRSHPYSVNVCDPKYPEHHQLVALLMQRDMRHYILGIIGKKV